VKFFDLKPDDLFKYNDRIFKVNHYWTEDANVERIDKPKLYGDNWNASWFFFPDDEVEKIGTYEGDIREKVGPI
jgi:hypothetical protein